MSSIAKLSCSIESSASLDANYTYSIIIKSNSDEQKKESAEANLTCGQPKKEEGRERVELYSMHGDHKTLWVPRGSLHR